MKRRLLSLLDTYYRAEQRLNALQAIALLSARLYLAWIFLAAGLTKIRDWGSTLYLFQDEYHVPWLPSELAAYLGTGGELLFPVLLALGLFGRAGALGLFVVNVVAVLSLTEIAPAALGLHVLWGALLISIVAFGPGLWSVDMGLRLLRRRD